MSMHLRNAVLLAAFLALLLGGYRYVQHETKPPSDLQPKTLEERLAPYRDTYVGDSVAVGSILAQLPAPGPYAVKGFSLQTKEKPYGVRIAYAEIPSARSPGGSDPPQWGEARQRDLLEAQAAVMLALIRNAETVTFELDGGSDRQIAYTRWELETKYGKSLEEAMQDPRVGPALLSRLETPPADHPEAADAHGPR